MEVLDLKRHNAMLANALTSRKLGSELAQRFVQRPADAGGCSGSVQSFSARCRSHDVATPVRCNLKLAVLNEGTILQSYVLRPLLAQRDPLLQLLNLSFVKVHGLNNVFGDV